MTMTQEQAEKMVDDLISNTVAGALECNICGLALDKWKPINDVGVRSARAAIITALTAPGVLEGWKLVPEEVTGEMCSAYWRAKERYEDVGGTMPDDQWAAMLAAAPPAPVVSLATSDDETTALVSLVRSGIRTDIQELLVYGSKRAQVPPGALRKAIDAVLKARGQGGAT